MSDKNIEIIKHIQRTGMCPEDDSIATSMFSESGFQPKVNNGYIPEESMETCPFGYEFEIKHLNNDVAWYKKMMEEYRESFWKVCDMVAKSSDLVKLKELTKKELQRY